MSTQKKKRLLVIGCAQQHHIKAYIENIDYSKNQIHLLAPERDVAAYDSLNVTYFSGVFHPLFSPLLRTMFIFKPDEVVIVCGLTYDHDNVVHAVSFYSNFKNIRITLSVRNCDSPAPISSKVSPVKEVAKWAGLGAIALLIKAIAPVIKIRAGELYSGRLGHLALECEIYLSEAELGYHDNRWDFFYFKDGKVANKTLGQMYARKMRIFGTNKYILDAIRRFNLSQDHEVTLNTKVMKPVRDSECVIQQTENHIEFTPDQNKQGINGLQSMGLDPAQKHICIFGRDSAYLQTKMPAFNDSDMQDSRDMDIDAFIPSVNELLDLGYNVLRVGSIVKKSLPINHPNFVDYATNGQRSDFMDIYLTANCKFFVGIQSGVQQVANVFRVPCLRVNVVRLEIIEYCSPEDQALFKLYWSKTEKRLLKVHEIIESGMGLWPIEKFANSDIELIDNTEDELLEAVKEMHKKVKGTWNIQSEDLELQNRYRACFKTSPYNSRFTTPISSYFLKKHAADLL